MESLQIWTWVERHRVDKGSVTVEDLETLRTQDIVGAVTDACAEKHVPIQP